MAVMASRTCSPFIFRLKIGAQSTTMPPRTTSAPQAQPVSRWNQRSVAAFRSATTSYLAVGEGVNLVAGTTSTFQDLGSLFLCRSIFYLQ